jgi:hypothetical protein
MDDPLKIAQSAHEAVKQNQNRALALFHVGKFFLFPDMKTHSDKITQK